MGVRLPFVHRARFEAVEHIASAAQQAEREMRTQLVALTQLVAEMKRAGFEGVAHSGPVPADVEPKQNHLPADVVLAIADRAVEGTPIHRRLTMQATGWLDGNMSVAEAASRIREGGNVDDLLYGSVE